MRIPVIMRMADLFLLLVAPFKVQSSGKSLLPFFRVGDW